MTPGAILTLIFIVVLLVIGLKYLDSMPKTPDTYKTNNQHAIRLFKEYRKLVKYWLTHFQDPGFVNWGMDHPLPGGPVKNELALDRLKNPHPSDPEFLDFLISNKGIPKDKAKQIVDNFIFDEQDE